MPTALNRRRMLDDRGYTTRKSAFTLIELLVVIAIIALIMSILLPALANARLTTRRVTCLQNMKSLGQAHANYRADSDGRIASFNWEWDFARNRAKIHQTKYPQLNNAPDPWTMHMRQATYILYENTNLTPTDGILDTRFPHRRYSHLPLTKYLTDSHPVAAAACPSDFQLQSWRTRGDDEYDFLGTGLSNPNDFAVKMTPFSSSYQLVPAAYSPDQGGENFNSPSTLEQASTQNLFWMLATDLRQRRVRDVQLPSNKVQMFEFHDWHQERTPYHAYESAKPGLLFFDGSTRTYRTGDTNPGFAPNRPNLRSSRTVYFYEPDVGEPDTLSGDPRDRVVGHFRWTRDGLKGWDVEAPQSDPFRRP